MSEDLFRRSITMILLAGLRMMAIFIALEAEKHHNLVVNQYRDEAWKTYTTLEIKLSEALES